MSEAVLAALRGSCSHVCSYATPHAPGSGCGGVCKRSLNDFDNEEIQNMTIALRAADAARAVPDEEVVDMLERAIRNHPSFDGRPLICPRLAMGALAALRAAGLKVVWG